MFNFSRNKIINKEVISWKNFEPEALENKVKSSRRILLVSVLPEKTDLLKELLAKKKNQIQVVGEDLFPDMKILTEEPGEVGCDRLLAAYAAWHKVRSSAIVIDLGTALTIDYIDNERCFHGGIIAPGFQSSAQALLSSAPRLAGSNLSGSVRIPGRNTGEAIRSGLLHMIAGGIERIVHQYQEIDPDAKVVTTGGDFPRILDEVEFPFLFDEDLLGFGLLQLSKS